MSAEQLAIEPGFHINITGEAMMFYGQLADSNQTGMTFGVISVPEASLALSECFGDQLDRRRCVGREDEVYLICIEAKVCQGLQSYAFNVARGSYTRF
jgi:hypothetical protein